MFTLAIVRLSQTQVTTELPYAKDIAAFRTQDRENPPAKGQILFIGSSSFTRWKDVGQAFQDRKILNRAFGGSTLSDVIEHVEDVVYPYHPRQVVIYCGENDLAGDPKLPAFKVFDRFKILFALIRKRYPKVPIAYVSMKPSPSRWHLRAKYIAGNRWIAEFCAQSANATFIDIWDAMLNDHGVPKPDIFVQDRLHMNADGYRIWQPIIARALVSP